MVRALLSFTVLAFLTQAPIARFEGVEQKKSDCFGPANIGPVTG